MAPRTSRAIGFWRRCLQWQPHFGGCDDECAIRLRATLCPGCKKPFRHVELIWDALDEAGLRIIDHKGEAVPEGGHYGLKVLSFELVPGLATHQVIETVKPSVYFGETRIQTGEVIVGTPEESASADQIGG